MIPHNSQYHNTPRPNAVDKSLDTKTHLRWIAFKLWIIAMTVALGVALSGCVPGSGGVKHHYSNAYGHGTVYYNSGDYHHHHHAPRPPKKHKKHKHKKHKHKKHKHHHDDD